MIKKVIRKKDRSSGSFGMMSMYQKYAKMWICYNHDFTYTRFEELCTYSGEVIFTREQQAITSKDKPNSHIDTDRLQVFKDFITEDKDKTTPKSRTIPKTKAKTKTQDKNPLGKTNNKIDTTNKRNKRQV